MSKLREKQRPPKRVLALPDLNNLTSESGQRAAVHATMTPQTSGKSAASGTG